MSQLVMRSFDVADKGEVNKGDGPLEKRGERTPGHNHSKEEGKGGKKEQKSVGGGRKQHQDRTERVLHNCSLSPRPGPDWPSGAPGEFLMTW